IRPSREPPPGEYGEVTDPSFVARVKDPLMGIGSAATLWATSASVKPAGTSIANTSGPPDKMLRTVENDWFWWNRYEPGTTVGVPWMISPSLNANALETTPSLASASMAVPAGSSWRTVRTTWRPGPPKGCASNS